MDAFVDYGIVPGYVTVNGRRFRKGYTTGSCAAAAAKAAVQLLVSGIIPEDIEIDTPAGIRLKLPVCDASIASGMEMDRHFSDEADSERTAVCAVIKDGGDDPDVTNGLKIYAQARFAAEPGIKVEAGEGIGMVTLPGLRVDVGKPAINPVPMRMILKEAEVALQSGRGAVITLSVPGGDEVAKNTYNPKLGIMGGISILGTTGIVNPMSEEAWKDSLALELDMLHAAGKRIAVFAFGNYGEDFVTEKLGINKDSIIKISNFIGFMLDKAVEAGFEKILVAGHGGKLVKVAAGIFHTHSRVADARMEILAAYAALEGAPTEVVRDIYRCTTTEAASAIINNAGLSGVYRRIAENAAVRCRQYTHGKINTGAVLFNSDNNLLAMDAAAQEIIDEIREQV